mmetsp:Transcript_5187/g.10739  ORF Transcript_5187/g.10739 Transcript_5187/m.10739 type:complete len:99 (+) Transcript_5187:673-969(+)
MLNQIILSFKTFLPMDYLQLLFETIDDTNMASSSAFVAVSTVRQHISDSLNGANVVSFDPCPNHLLKILDNLLQTTSERPSRRENLARLKGKSWTASS